MKKNNGRLQQIRGDKRHAKFLKRKKKKKENETYLAKLILKYGENLKLKDRKQPGSDYWEWYLNNNDEEKKNG